MRVQDPRDLRTILLSTLLSSVATTWHQKKKLESGVNRYRQATRQIPRPETSVPEDDVGRVVAKHDAKGKEYTETDPQCR